MTSAAVRISDISSTVATTTTVMTTTAMPSMRPIRADLLLKRRRLFGGRLEHLGDRAHLRLHAGRRDHGAAGALDDSGALEDHVETIAERARRPGASPDP